MRSINAWLTSDNVSRTINMGRTSNASHISSIFLMHVQLKMGHYFSYTTTNVCVCVCSWQLFSIDFSSSMPFVAADTTNKTSQSFLIVFLHFSCRQKHNIFLSLSLSRSVGNFSLSLSFLYCFHALFLFHFNCFV